MNMVMGRCCVSCGNDEARVVFSVVPRAFHQEHPEAQYFCSWCGQVYDLDDVDLPELKREFRRRHPALVGKIDCALSGVADEIEA